MNRRDFLKNSIGAALVSAVPVLAAKGHGGNKNLFTGEVGRYEGVRIIEDPLIPKGQEYWNYEDSPGGYMYSEELSEQLSAALAGKA